MSPPAERAASEIQTQALDLSEPAAGQQRDDAALRVDAKGGARGGAVDLQRNLVGERMTDEARLHGVARVEIDLEGQQAQHQIHRSGDVPDPALTPRPHLRADVLHGAQAALLEPAREAQIEFRRIDADEGERLPGQDFTTQPAAQPEQAR
jgi:hypothetical protein